MELEINCFICSREFNKTIVVPKLLNCGHSFCLNCVKGLLVSTLNCPKCKTKLENNKTAEEYPTVLFIIDAVKLVKKVLMRSLSEKKIKKRIDGLKESITIWNTKINATLGRINDDLLQLQSLTNSKEEIKDLKKAEQAVEVLEKEYKINIQTYQFPRLENFFNISLKDFENGNEYLRAIYNSLLNGENVYVSKTNCDDSRKYGKLTVENNGIFFFAFSETNIPDNSSVVYFDELRKCDNRKPLLTFLKLCINKQDDICTVVIKMEDSPLTSQFVRFCSGERGPTYKGCYYQKFLDTDPNAGYPILKLKNYMTLSVKGVSEEIYVEEGESYVVGEMDGGFKIYKSRSTSWIKCIGIVESPPLFYDYISFEGGFTPKVVECGIIFKVL